MKRHQPADMQFMASAGAGEDDVPNPGSSRRLWSREGALRCCSSAARAETTLLSVSWLRTSEIVGSSGAPTVPLALDTPPDGQDFLWSLPVTASR